MSHLTTLAARNLLRARYTSTRGRVALTLRQLANVQWHHNAALSVRRGLTYGDLCIWDVVDQTGRWRTPTLRQLFEPMDTLIPHEDWTGLAIVAATRRVSRLRDSLDTAEKVYLLAQEDAELEALGVQTRQASLFGGGR